jgi:hypothetical protein
MTESDMPEQETGRRMMVAGFVLAFLIIGVVLMAVTGVFSR